jgi:hypothetical protein
VLEKQVESRLDEALVLCEDIEHDAHICRWVDGDPLAAGFQTLWNMVLEYMARPTPISIPLMHRRFTEDQRGLRPPFPPLHSFMALPVLPDVSEGKRVLILFFFLF